MVEEKRNIQRKNLKYKLIIEILVFIVISLIFFTNKVNATNEIDVITKRTDKIIEGYSKIVDDDEDEDIQLDTTPLFSSTNLLRGTSITLEYAKNYYYNQLTTDIARDVYNELKKDTTGEGYAEVELDNQVFDIDITQVDNTEYIKSIFAEKVRPYIYDGRAALIYDAPELYYWWKPNIVYFYIIDNAQKKITFTKIKLSSQDSFSEIKNDYKNFNSKLKVAIDSIQGNSIYDIIKNCHDYVCNSVESFQEENTVIDQTAYDALINKKGVCEAQASLFTLLCRGKDIICIRVSGKANNGSKTENHAWNYVYHPEEKKWYAVDTTWDNKKRLGKETIYTYFLVGNDTVVAKWNDADVTFSENHIHGNNYFSTFMPIVPTLSDEKYENFSGKYTMSPKEKTNKTVKVTLTANREMNSVEGWEISDDKKTITKVYEQNVEENIPITNSRNESFNFKFKIENIDKIKPEAVVSYSTENVTNKNVTATITANEELQALDGWTLSEDKMILSKTYLTNTTENVSIKDIAGNTETVTISIKNIDKEVLEGTVTYSTQQKTNKNVIATITSNKELQKLEGWDLSADKKALTKEFSENITQNYTIQDLVGNTSTIQVKISNIDKTKPEATLTYNPTTSTNQNVVATITANEELQELEGWTLSKDKKILTKTYIENTKENITIKDIAGNTTTLSITINNIDKQNAQCVVSYSTIAKTNKNVIATITSNKELKKLEGWTLSEDKKVLTKEFSENVTQNYTVQDLLGNVSTVQIKIANIDKTKPEIKVTQSPSTVTNKNVSVMITSNEELQELEGWTLSSDKKKLQKEFSSNTAQNIEVQDIAGNKESIKINITNIDKEEPEYVVSYSEKALTNKDILVTIRSNKEIEKLDGWELSENKKEITKIYKENSNDTLKIKSVNGFEKQVNVVVNNIDKIAPKINVTYNEPDEEGKVILTITSNEELQEKEGYTLSSDKKTLTKTFSMKISDEIAIVDVAGNIEKVKIEINDVTPKETNNEQQNEQNKNEQQNEQNKNEQNNETEKQENKEDTNQPSFVEDENEVIRIAKIPKTVKATQPKQLTQSKQTKEIDKTTAQTVIPQTGNNGAMITAIIIILLFVVAITAFKKYTNLNKFLNKFRK